MELTLDNALVVFIVALAAAFLFWKLFGKPARKPPSGPDVKTENLLKNMRKK